MTLIEINEAFESAEGVIEEAQQAHAAFVALVAAYFRETPPRNVVEIEAQTGRKIAKIKFASLPRQLRIKGYAVATHLRHALDHAVYAATLCIDGEVKGTKTYFPCAADADQFDTLFRPKGNCRHLATAIIPTLKGFEPWFPKEGHPGGNFPLRMLLKIANPLKHEVALMPTPNFNAVQINQIVTGRHRGIKIFPERIRGTNDFLVAELEPEGDFHIDCNIPFFIALTQVDDLAKVPFQDFLALCISIVVKIVGTIKQETIRIVGPA